MFKKKINKSDGDLKASFGESTVSFIGTILLILALRWALFEPYVIPSGSMIPTLLINDHILVNKGAFGIRVPFSKNWISRWGEPEIGDIVVFRSVNKDSFFLIKRVVGLPGDTIEFTEEGVLLRNHQPVVSEPLSREAQRQGEGPFYPVSEIDLEKSFSSFKFYKNKLGEHEFRSLLMEGGFRWPQKPLKIPPGHFFAIGDNRDNSQDSRSWGVVPFENLLGKAMFVWLSCEESIPAINMLCIPTTLRWDRFGHGVQH